MKSLIKSALVALVVLVLVAQLAKSSSAVRKIVPFAPAA
jgi:hypothetical protein